MPRWAGIILCLVVMVQSVFIILISAGYASMSRRARSICLKYRSTLEYLTNMTSESLETSRRDVLKNTAIMILIMKMCALAGEYEKMTMCYNRLFFLGVPKMALEDGDMLNEFLERCIAGEMEVNVGKKPYQFEFVFTGKGEGSQTNKETRRVPK